MSNSSRWRSWRRRAQILRRPRGEVPELARGAKRPIRIAQQLAREKHAVRLALANDLVGLRRGRDEPDGAGRDAGIAADPLGERHLVARTHRDRRVAHVAARRAVDEIDAVARRPPAQFDGLVDVPPTRRSSRCTRSAANSGRAPATHSARRRRPRGRAGCGCRTSRRIVGARVGQAATGTRASGSRGRRALR